MMKIKFAGMALLMFMLGILSGCGGGGSSTPAASIISGVAAVGDPIVNGTVQIKCATGSTITTTTNSNGAYTATLSGQTLPCAVEVSGGNIGSGTGPANATSYHSIATALGTVNITPLTDLMIANLAQQDPGSWFAGLTGATLSPITTAQVNTSLTNLRAALTGLPPLSTINPITTNFTAISGNVSDDMLEALGIATATPGSYAALLGAAGIPATFTSAAATLNGTLPAAYLGTASGSLPTVASFAPSSGVVGITVTITGTNFSTTPANNTVRFNGVQASVTTATTTQLVVTVPATATSGNITVLVGGQTATSTTGFTVTAAGTGTNAALVGTWQLMTYKLNTAAAATDMSPYNMILVLSANGNWVFTQPATVGTCQQSGTSTSTATTFTFTTVTDPCTTPTTAGKVEIDTYTISGTTLTANNGTEAFTYQKQTVAAPTLTSFTPASGAAGTAVTITGTNLSAVTEVLFTGPAPGTAFASGTITAHTATSITVTVPASLAAGSYTVSVIHPGGEVAATGAFTVSASPAYVVQGGLTWMPVTFGDTWTNANAYCTNTTINGLTGWRQPTQAELTALYTSGAMSGQGWTLNWTWSSTPGTAGFHIAVGLAPGGGVNPFADGTTPIPVSCVRQSAGGGGTATAYGACTHSSLSICSGSFCACDAYIGSYFIDSATIGTPGISNQQNSCLAPDIWAASSNCSTANRVGACRFNVGLSTEFQTTFYPPFTVLMAQTLCVSPGVWVP